MDPPPPHSNPPPPGGRGFIGTFAITSFDKTLLSVRKNIGKFRLYVNYFFPQDVVPSAFGIAFGLIKAVTGRADARWKWHVPEAKG
jgi:hypothetical protein